MRDSLANSTVTCPDKRTCDKAFTLAKIYVQEHADMKIQSSDDTIVSTYNPTDYGRMALTATRTPESGDSSTIKLVATCKGMDSGSDLFFKMCAERIAPTYKNFKSFIESKMN